MLNPSDRLVYLNLLQPPADYTLDHAVATTFSLDLLALFGTQLSLTNLTADNSNDLLSDPTRLLEALRQTGDRLTVFCQQGRISMPKTNNLLFSYLESIVYEVQPRTRGVFHPKLWVIRFVSEDKPTLYRLICLSRNLTFDCSWDTILVLEGTVQTKRTRLPQNKPLVDFLVNISRLSNTLPAARQDIIAQMTDELHRVPFATPSGFEPDLTFYPLGDRRSRPFRELTPVNRLMMVSPFITEEGLEPLTKATRGILISRPDELDSLSPDFLQQLLAKRTEIYTFQDAVEHPEASAEESEEAVVTTDLSGLHAKLYIVEQGSNVRIFTGSANATSAARTQNVEFMVELKGKKYKLGIDAMLGRADDKYSLRNLIQPYVRSQDQPAVDPSAKKLEDILNVARTALCRATPKVSVTTLGSAYSMQLTVTEVLTLDQRITSASCYPITQNSNWAKDLSPAVHGAPLVFSPLSLVGITGLWAFSLTAELQGAKQTTTFVLNLPVENMPPDRDHAILLSIISNREAFIRYLAFLLGDPTNLTGLIASLVERSGPAFSHQSPYELPIPLLEELVRACSRYPEKIERVARIVADLTKTPEGQALLPIGFDALWSAIAAIQPGGARA
ncbi:MAG: hypothetical protein FD169_2077 [Bacillota bacterium]|nr:MAG: hypothetical protein FD169_2077 [Bacillota bacterium]